MPNNDKIDIQGNRFRFYKSMTVCKLNKFKNNINIIISSCSRIV